MFQKYDSLTKAQSIALSNPKFQNGIVLEFGIFLLEFFKLGIFAALRIIFSNLQP